MFASFALVDSDSVGKHSMLAPIVSLVRRDEADAAVAMLAVVPSDKLHDPVERELAGHEGLLWICRSILQRFEERLDEGIVVAHTRTTEGSDDAEMLQRRDQLSDGSSLLIKTTLTGRTQPVRELTIVSAGMGVLAALLEEERVKLCGPRYAHQPERSAMRAGHTDGELAFGGRRVGVRRPRVCSVEGDEVTLETWERFARRIR